MTAFLEMVVPGRPVPKARPRVGANGNVYTPRETAEAEGAVGWAAKVKVRGRKATGPLAVTAIFYVTGRRKGDIDNLLKTVLDGLNKIAYADDSQVVRAEALIVIDPANPRTEITVTQLPVPHALTAGGTA